MASGEMENIELKKEDFDACVDLNKITIKIEDE